jgi:hypothetical protein
VTTTTATVRNACRNESLPAPTQTATTGSDATAIVAIAATKLATAQRGVEMFMSRACLDG